MPVPLVETARIALDPDEHAKLGELIRAAEAAKLACTKYIDELGVKYSLYAGTTDCSIGFESGYAVVKEPRRVLRASTDDPESIKYLPGAWPRSGA